MTYFAALLQQGTASAWLFIPSAILLGALHGLEPGHSKTMMAAFIIAIRGTVAQAALLGLAATLSHTAVVWAVALIGMSLGREHLAEASEPWLQVASAVLIVGVASWMLLRTWQEQTRERHAASAADGHAHDHAHDETRRIDTGHGVAVLSIYEAGMPPHFRIAFEPAADAPASQDISVTTERPDGTRQRFAFVQRHGFLESADTIPEPHSFTARLEIGHGNHTHAFSAGFAEHDHDHGLDVSAPGYQDAHEQAHADDIRRRFASRNVTTGQIVLFGLTGGLIPCPAAITVLLLCLQLKQFVLGVGLVLCFSIGLALTMVTTGAIAALSVHHVGRRWRSLSLLVRRAPYVSSILIFCIGLYVGWEGVRHL